MNNRIEHLYVIKNVTNSISYLISNTSNTDLNNIRLLSKNLNIISSLDYEGLSLLYTYLKDKENKLDNNDNKYVYNVSIDNKHVYNISIDNIECVTNLIIQNILLEFDNIIFDKKLEPYINDKVDIYLTEKDMLGGDNVLITQLTNFINTGKELSPSVIKKFEHLMMDEYDTSIIENNLVTSNKNINTIIVDGEEICIENKDMEEI